jgi:hypothetical protein
MCKSWQSFFKRDGAESGRPAQRRFRRHVQGEVDGDHRAAGGILGIRTRYRDLSHDLQIVFYSPEGLSVELTDKVEYEVQLIDHDKGYGDTACQRALRCRDDPRGSSMESAGFPGSTKLM